MQSYLKCIAHDDVKTVNESAEREQCKSSYDLKQKTLSEVIK